MTTSSGYRAVGQATPRVEGREKVTGAAQYVIDVAPPGTLWCRFLRSPHAHARVTRFDASKALELPGVHAVLAGDDVRGLLTGYTSYVDEPLLASWDRVRFIGDKVAAVAAEDEDTAERALGLIEVEYEELPAVLTAEAAARPDAPVLHPDFNSYRGVTPQETPSNVYGRTHDAWGDVEAGFAEADMIVERTYRTPRAHQAYLEPHSATVLIDDEGKAQVWVSTQSPTGRRVLMARLMGLSREDVVVHFAHIGGAFGGKIDATAAVVCYFLAKQTGRPVKYVMDYAEEFSAMNPRHPSTVRVKAGVKRDGTITAWEAEAWFATGAYAGYAPVPELGGLFTTTSVNCYNLPNVRLDGYQVYTNTVPCGYFRGPGMVQTIFAAESHMDVLARALGMDPFDFRLKNIVRRHEEVRGHHAWRPALSPADPDYQPIRLEETLRAAAEAAGYFDPKPANVGRGIALHEAVDSGFDTHAAVHIHEDGRIVANMSVFDPGMGTATVLAQIVSEQLQVPVERIQVEPWDTRGPRDWGVGGQRGVRTMSQAAHSAGVDARQNLQRLAAEYFGWSEESIVLREGQVMDGASGRGVPIEEIAARSGAPVSGKGDVDVPRETNYVSFAAHIAEVAVDPETGQVRVVTYTAAHETGKVLNPMAFEGQIQGGVVQGIGHALMEELVVDESGRVANPSFADYKIPSERDVPAFRTVVLDSEVGNGPYKTRGIADMPINLPSPAIANAIADACGVRVQELPLTAEKVWRGMRLRSDEQR